MSQNQNQIDSVASSSWPPAAAADCSSPDNTTCTTDSSDYLLRPSRNMEDKAVDLARKTCINDLPKNIIVQILDHVPIQDAVKTSILCRSWRFNWTMLKHLNFDFTFFTYLERKIEKELLLVSYSKTISRVLLHHQGTVLKFCLWRPAGIDHGDIDHWILFLLTKGVMEFTIYGTDSTCYKLPTHLCSFADLTYLKLTNCSFKTTPAFTGFPSLKELVLLNIPLDFTSCWKLIDCCRLLEKFVFDGAVFDYYINNIAKLQNLKECKLGFYIWNPNFIVDLVQSLSSLQKLEEVDLCWKDYFRTGRMKKWVPAVFQSLRVLKLDSINFKCSTECLLVRQLICCSPQLQQAVITSGESVDPVFEELPASYWDEDCTNAKLQNVTLISFKGLTNELKLIKFLLACSPRLEKLCLGFHPDLDQVSHLRDALRISKELMKFHRASTKAEIDFSYQ